MSEKFNSDFFEANKDGGTSVGFSGYMQVLCKEGEHKYGEVTLTTSGTNCDTEYYSEVRCQKCGQKPIPTKTFEVDDDKAQPMDGKGFNRFVADELGQWQEPKTDFKISKNIEQINKQEWEDIWDVWHERMGWGHTAKEFYEWVSVNYLAPENKNEG